MDDDTIRLDFQLDDSQARRNAKDFAAFLRSEFEKAQKALNDALAGGVANAENADRIKQLRQEVNKAERELNAFEKTVGLSAKQLRDQAKAAAEAEKNAKSYEKQIASLEQEIEKLSRQDLTDPDTQRELTRLQRELQKTERQFKTFQRAQQTARQVNDQLGDSYNDLQRELTETNKRIRDLSAADRQSKFGRGLIDRSRQLTTQLKEIDASIGVNNRNVGNYASALDGLRGSLGRVTSLLGGLGLVGVATSFADLTQRVIEFGNASIDAFGEFDTRVREVRTLLPNISDDAFGSLIDDLQSVGLELGRTSDELVPALYQALSAGVPPENVIDFIRTAGNAARGGVTDLTTSVDTLTSVVNAYGEDVLSVQEASDAVFTAVRLGKTTFEEIGASISQVTPIASALGVGFDDITAAIAVLTAGGTPTSQAITQITAALQELTKPQSRVSQLFRETTGQDFPAFIAAGGNLQQALDVVANSTDNLAGTFGQKEGLLATLALAGDNADKYRDALAEVQAATGATDAAAAQFADSLQLAQQRSDAASEALRLAVGESLAPYRRAWLETATAIAQATEASIRAGQELGSLRESSRAAREEFEQIAGASSAFESLEQSVFSFDNTAANLQQRAKDVGVEIRQAFSIESEAAAFEAASRIIQGGFQGTSEELIRLIELQLRGVESGREFNATSIEAESALRRQAAAQSDANDQAESAERLTVENTARQAELTESYLAQKRANEEAQAAAQQDARARLDLLAATEALDQAVEDGLLSRQAANNLLVQAAGDADALTAATQRLTQAQIEQGNATRSAISGAGSRILGLIAPATGGGGGGAARIDVEEEIGRIREESEEEIAEIREDNAERIAELESDNADKLTDRRVKAEQDIAAAREAGLADIAQAEQNLANARLEAERQFNRERATGLIEAAERARAGESIDTEADALARARQLAESGDLTPQELEEALIAQELLNQEQAAAVRLEEERRRTLDALDEAFRNGEVNAQQYADATRQVNEQLASGQAIDISDFGITPETVQEFIENATSAEQQAVTAAKQQLADNIRAIEQQLATDIVAIQNELAAQVAAANERAADAIITAQQRAADAVVSAQERAAQATGGGGRAAREAGDSYAELAVKQLLAKAAQEETTEAQLAGIESALALAQQFDLITEAEARQQLAAAELDAAQADLRASQDFVTLSAENQREAIELLEAGIARTRDEAVELAEKLDSETAQSLIDVKADTARLNSELDRLGIVREIQIEDNTEEANGRLDGTGRKLQELEDSDPNVDIFVRDDAANAAINGVKDNLDSIEDKTVNLTVNEQVNRATGGGTNEGLTAEGFNRGGRPRVGQDILVGDGPNGQILPTTEIISFDRPGTVISGNNTQSAIRAIVSNPEIARQALPEQTRNEVAAATGRSILRDVANDANLARQVAPMVTAPTASQSFASMPPIRFPDLVVPTAASNSTTTTNNDNTTTTNNSSQIINVTDTSGRLADRLIDTEFNKRQSRIMRRGRGF